MIELFKAVPFGTMLTWFVSLFMGSAGSSGGVLTIRLVEIADTSFHWSWPLFMIGTLLAWALMLLQR